MIIFHTPVTSLLTWQISCNITCISGYSKKLWSYITKPNKVFDHSIAVKTNYITIIDSSKKPPYLLCVSLSVFSLRFLTVFCVLARTTSMSLASPSPLSDPTSTKSKTKNVFQWIVHINVHSILYNHVSHSSAASAF